MVKNLPASAEDVRGTGSSPGSGRSPGEVCGNPCQYSCRENPMDRGTWQAIVHGVVKNWTQMSIWAQPREREHLLSTYGLSRWFGGERIHMPMQEMQETWVQSLGWEDPLEEEMATHSPIFLPGESRGQRSLVGYSPWGCKSRVWLSDWGCMHWVRSIFCVPALFLAALHGVAYFMLSGTLWKRCYCPRWLTSIVKYREVNKLSQRHTAKEWGGQSVHTLWCTFGHILANESYEQSHTEPATFSQVLPWQNWVTVPYLKLPR